MYRAAPLSSWVKIKNPTYSQAEGRRQLFKATWPKCGVRLVLVPRDVALPEGCLDPMTDQPIK